MKDINKLKDYRLKYKRYYNIDFDSSFAIHHIDFNHKNNDIKNLLLLPRSLHNAYHLILDNMFSGKDKKDFCLDQEYPRRFFLDFEKTGKVMEEVKKWIEYKSQLDMAKFYER